MFFRRTFLPNYKSNHNIKNTGHLHNYLENWSAVISKFVPKFFALSTRRSVSINIIFNHRCSAWYDLQHMLCTLMILRTFRKNLLPTNHVMLLEVRKKVPACFNFSGFWNGWFLLQESYAVLELVTWSGIRQNLF